MLGNNFILMNIKENFRTFLQFLHLDLTKNLSYDRLTKIIIRDVLSPSSNAIDVGCHKGEILDLIIKAAPEGKHFAFEPIPFFYNQLQKKYVDVNVLPYALSNKSGVRKFKYVKNAPAYSGLKERTYKNNKPEIKNISVRVEKLDECIPKKNKIDLIKIDVEGGEFDVLKGGQDLLYRDQPVLIFESGLGASEYYGTNPTELFIFLSKIGYNIYSLKAYINSENPYTEQSFVKCYNNNDEYYFVAKQS